jgi:transposase
MATAHRREYSTAEPVLYLAFELGVKRWKLGFSSDGQEHVRRRTIAAGDLVALGQEIGRACEKLRLPGDVSIRSCYEAGLEGFWLHRHLIAQGISNVVVDSASIEVNRRRRRAKTDRLDVQKLVWMLRRYSHGELAVWHVVHVPSEEAEDGRQLHRQLLSFRHDRTRHRNRIWGLLRTQGLALKLDQDFSEGVQQARTPTGTPLPPGLQQRLRREYRLYETAQALITEIEAERRERIATEETRQMQMVRDLMGLRAIGENTAWILVMEFFGWREFHNRREVGALAGLTPTPYQSGESHQEQGISKAGNTWVRHAMVEVTWQWLRYQPDSVLTQWFAERYAEGGRAMRKRGCTAVARKLLIALWKYLETGEIPEGAQLKPST